MNHVGLAGETRIMVYNSCTVITDVEATNVQSSCSQTLHTPIIMMSKIRIAYHFVKTMVILVC